MAELQDKNEISSTLQVGDNARVDRRLRGAQGPNSEVSFSTAVVLRTSLKVVSFVCEKKSPTGDFFEIFTAMSCRNIIVHDVSVCREI